MVDPLRRALSMKSTEKPSYSEALNSDRPGLMLRTSNPSGLSTLYGFWNSNAVPGNADFCLERMIPAAAGGNR
jgi:hypothetical protein